MRNIHLRFDQYYIGKIYGGDFAKFCGLLRIYELYFVRYLNGNFDSIAKSLKLISIGTNLNSLLGKISQSIPTTTGKNVLLYNLSDVQPLPHSNMFNRQFADL